MDISTEWLKSDIYTRIYPWIYPWISIFTASLHITHATYVRQRTQRPTVFLRFGRFVGYVSCIWCVLFLRSLLLIRTFLRALRWMRIPLFALRLNSKRIRRRPTPIIVFYSILSYICEQQSTVNPPVR